MPTTTIDTFTGPETVNIEGRIPDGGGDASLQTGQWARADGSPGAGTFDILTHAFRGGQDGTQANNAASITVDLPLNPPVGGFLGVVIGTRDSTLRDPTTPTGYTEINSATGSGKVVLYGRTVDGTEGLTLTVNFTGGGGAGCDQLAFAFAVEDFSAVGQLGAASSWLSADDLGPITGITPEAADSLILMIGFKQNDFSGTSPPASATGWFLGSFRESTAGTDAGMVLLWQQQNGLAVVPSTTITDTGGPASAGAGVGFMVELKRLSSLDSCCRHRTPSGVLDWNHYVAKDIPDIGGPGLTDYAVEGIFRFYDEQAVFIGVLARHNDDVTETGYEWNYVPAVTGSAGTATLELYYIWAGTYNILRTINLTGVNYDVDVKLRICVSGASSSVDFECYYNDVRMIPDDGTLDPLGNFIHTPPGGQEIVGGWPGACLNDGSSGRDGHAIKLLRFRVATDCGDTEVPCTGGPDNPYPNDPPPREPIPFGFHVMQQGAWREVIVDPIYDPDNVRPEMFGARRTPTSMHVMTHGVWRPIGTVSEEFPTPNTPLPPFYDPCLILEELPPGTIVPMPLTERFLGISHLPISIGGPVLNGTRMGLWGGIGSAFAQAAARGVIITTSPGGRHPYLGPNGEWSLPHFINRSLELLQPVLSILQAEVAAGRYPGHSIIDDFESPKLWKPNGVPHDELQSALATIRAACPGIPFGVRGRPSQFSTNLGFDFYEAAYKSWGGHTPTSFVYLEYNRAKAWGATIQLHMNYLHGGNGSSGILHNDGTMLSGHYEMSANEVATYLVGMYDAADAIDGGAILQGTNGYEYTSTYLQRPGMIDAFTIGRNRLAALPPLP